MITLTLNNGAVLCFNLKNTKREKLLRDAWYSMSDTPRFTDRKLKITTDKGQDYEYKIGDVKDCQYKKGKHTEKPRETKGEKEVDEELAKILGTSVTDEQEEDDQEQVEEELKALLGTSSDEFARALHEIAESIPQEKRQKATEFLKGIHENGVAIDMEDKTLFAVMMKVMEDDVKMTPHYIKVYSAYWKKHRKTC